MDTALDFGCVSAFIQPTLFDTELGGHSCAGWEEQYWDDKTVPKAGMQLL